MDRLSRSKRDKIFLGVCGGIGEYFNIDSTIVRLIFVVLGFANFGVTIVAYIAGGFIIPEENDKIYEDGHDNMDDTNERNLKLRKNTPLLTGLGLIILGAYLLTKMIFPGLFYNLRYIWNYWPILLIVLGIYVIFQKKIN